jgi:DNA-binding NtrC family response regulator
MEERADPSRIRIVALGGCTSRLEGQFCDLIGIRARYEVEFVVAEAQPRQGVLLSPDLILLIDPTAESKAAAERLRTGNRTPILQLVSEDAARPGREFLADGGDDFVLWPCSAPELEFRIHRLVGRLGRSSHALRRILDEEIPSANLIGTDPIFLNAIAQLPRFARCEAPICVTGETGTGKELCARAIHHLSRRKVRPFVAVDCGALPDQLFENEMFGHTRGAYTDAHRDSSGLVAMAEGGTLFLDEIDSLSLPAQAKLLRLLQEQSYRPLGSGNTISSDVRIVAATNCDLDAARKAQAFRSDLYFRLNVLRLRLPALRDRPGDIEQLAYAGVRTYDESKGPQDSGFRRLRCSCLPSQRVSGRRAASATLQRPFSPNNQ